MVGILFIIIVVFIFIYRMRDTGMVMKPQIKLLLLKGDNYLDNNQVHEALESYRKAGNIYDLGNEYISDYAQKIKFKIGITHFLMALDGENVEENLNLALKHMDPQQRLKSNSYIAVGYSGGTTANSHYYRGMIYKQLAFIKAEKTNLMKSIKAFNDGMIIAKDGTYDLCLSGLKTSYESLIEYYSERNDPENANKYAEKLNLL